jgi:hypothetical protein
MAHTSKQLNTYDGLATSLEPHKDLGLAMLIAESEDGQHEPVAVVGTINEAQEIAKNDVRDRMRRLEATEDTPLCPICYRVWARGNDGTYRVVYEIACPLE